MTQPNDLPPLPLLPSADGAYNEDNGAWSDTYHVDKMRAYATAYGLQCAEAAVERERARCLLETESMLETLDLAGEDSGKSHRVYAAGLLKFVADRIRK